VDANCHDGDATETDARSGCTWRMDGWDPSVVPSRLTWIDRSCRNHLEHTPSLLSTSIPKYTLLWTILVSASSSGDPLGFEPEFHPFRIWIERGREGRRKGRITGDEAGHDRRSMAVREALSGTGTGALAGAYVILRAFSWQIKASPFAFVDLVEAVERREPTALLDEVHLNLLRLLVADESEQERSEWEADLAKMDATTWTVFLWEWIRKHRWQWAKENLERCWTRGGPKAEYCWNHPDDKAAVLLELCDSAIESASVAEDIRTRERAGAFNLGEGPIQNGILSKWASLGWERYEEGPDGVMMCVNKDRFEDEDPNYDYCMLCGAGGNIVCCDRCPASYHMKCTGESRTKLAPEETWLCEECRFDGKGESSGLRVLDIGPDEKGRHCWMCHGVLFLVDPATGETSFVEGEEAKKQIDAIERVEASKKTRKSKQMDLDVSTRIARNAAKRNTPPYPPPASGISGPGGYLNKYRFAWQVKSTLLHSWRKASRKDEEEYGLPLPHSSFRWPLFATKGTQLEKCGKCTSCLVPTFHKPCLKYTIGGIGPCDLEVNIGPSIDRKCGGHLSTVMAYILKLERDVWSLLHKQWEWDLQWRKIWFEKVSKCCGVAEMGQHLLDLEEAMSCMLFTTGWSSSKETELRNQPHADSLYSKATACSWKKDVGVGSRIVDPDPSGPPDITLSKLDRQMHKYQLPLKVFKQARRQGGLKMLVGLDYSQNSRHATFSPQTSFRSQVTSATTSGELAYAIRLLDAYINWEGLRRPPAGFVGKVLNERVGDYGKEYFVQIPDPPVKAASGEKKFGTDQSLAKDEERSGIAALHAKKNDAPQDPRPPSWVLEHSVPLYMLKAHREHQRRLHATKEGKEMAYSPFKGNVSASKKAKQNGDRNKMQVKASKAKAYCLCQATDTDNDPMVMCDYCLDWFHPECVGLAWEDIEVMDRYKCPRCIKKHKNVPMHDGASTPSCTVCGTSCEIGKTGQECASCGVLLHFSCRFDAINECITEGITLQSKRGSRKEKWHCEACSAGLGRKKRTCKLCSVVGGALKKCKYGGWVHTVCALWVPETFINVDGLVEGLDEIPKRRSELTCTVCKQKCGAVVQCGHPSCGVPLHAQCARDAGLPMAFRVKDGYLRCTLYCKRHADLYGGQKHVPKSQSKMKPAKAVPVASSEGTAKRPSKGGKSVALEPPLAAKCLRELKRVMTTSAARWFLEPVNAESLGLFDYHKIVKKPMDLGTVCAKLEGNTSLKPYKSLKELVGDIRLVFANCKAYNLENSPVWKDCVATEQLLLSLFCKVGICGDGWQVEASAHCPASVTANPQKKNGENQAKDHAQNVNGAASLVSAADLQAVSKLLQTMLRSEYATTLDLNKSGTSASRKGGSMNTLRQVKTYVSRQLKGMEPKYASLESIGTDVTSALFQVKKTVDGRSKQARDARSLEKIFSESWEQIIRSEHENCSSLRSTGIQGKTNAVSSGKKRKAKEEPFQGGQLYDALLVIQSVLRMKRAQPFSTPVDAKALGLVDYHRIVRKPMDLGTIMSNIKRQIKSGEGIYGSAAEVYKDVCLVWDNCKLYNLEGSPIYADCLMVQKAFEKHWAEKGLPRVSAPGKQRRTS